MVRIYIPIIYSRVVTLVTLAVTQVAHWRNGSGRAALRCCVTPVALIVTQVIRCVTPVTLSVTQGIRCVTLSVTLVTPVAFCDSIT